jgi:PAS domain S-box-containing protein
VDGHVFKELLDQAPDAAIFAGTDGVISYWNAAAERIFGHPAESALGQSLDIIIPEQYREAHWRGFDRALADGDTKFRGQVLPTRALRADGETIYVELSFAIVKGSDGTVLGALAAARDITERWNRDREMRRELRELKQASAG